MAAAWNGSPQDVAYEVGSATGQVPTPQPQPDGMLDCEELTGIRFDLGFLGVIVPLWTGRSQADDKLFDGIRLQFSFKGISLIWGK